MTQVDLSHPQRCILEITCSRPSGYVFPILLPIRGGAVGNICKSFLRRGLIEETPAANSELVWRHDAVLGPVTLKATPRAYAALGLSQDIAQRQLESRARYEKFGSPKPSPAETIIALIQRPEGASVKEMAAETGWQAHSIRGLISSVLRKKHALLIETSRSTTRGTVYRIQGAGCS
jgi:Protein of unknown function (DUF3489)